jgi:riboflavin kinase / FMN adenylyltransferase
MTARIIHWQHGTEPLGSAVVAIGVFDGVHLGHQALLRDTVADAAARGVDSVAVTFDRDPDQIVSPGTAAPQLLGLADKLDAMSRTGLDAIVVVPFTTQLAELPPESFLDSVLLAALSPVAVHVGSDFRFGKMATGDVSTLQRVGAIRGFDVKPHDLVTSEGEAITSTRIRGLVAGGHIAEATQLLGGHSCVTGTVHRGRGEGAGLGFPTANVVPVEFAALPGSGVYAGRAALADGSTWAAAISVGTPPMFPDAKDYLEAHLIEFDGDLYDQPITLEFWDRLRDQRSYPDLDALKLAIAADVDRALEIAGFTDDEVTPDTVTIEDDHFDLEPPIVILPFINPLPRRTADDVEAEDYVSDPAALEAAEQAAMHAPDSFANLATGDWEPVGGEIWLESATAGAAGFLHISPLAAADIPYVWDPYPPESMPGGLRPAVSRPFTVLVPASQLAEAEALMAQAQADDDADFSPGAEIDDPEALEAAEQAVRGPQPERAAKPTHWTETDGEWQLLVSELPFDKQRLLALDAALFAAGIPAAWDPYRPDESPLLHLRLLSPNVFGISVPAEQVKPAREILREYFPAAR